MWGRRAGSVRHFLVAVGRGAFLPVLAVLASDFWRGKRMADRRLSGARHQRVATRGLRRTRPRRLLHDHWARDLRSNRHSPTPCYGAAVWLS